MTIAADLRIDQTVSAQVLSLLEKATLINQDTGFLALSDGLRDEQRRLRPSPYSISLISYSKHRPQLGFANVGTPTRVAKLLQRPIPNLGRLTPEKELQAWLIRSAASANGQVVPLSTILDGRFWFVSDEIAIRAPIDKGGSKKIVADLLLVNEDHQRRSQLVNVELKSRRSTDAFRQALNFRALLEHRDLDGLWKKFAETMTSRSFNWDKARPMRSLVIWPASGKPRFKNAYERIDVAAYEDRNTEFDLQIER